MRILIFYRHFPVAMGRYIHWGLEQAGHQVMSIGPWSEGRIPWPGDFYFPQDKMPPDILITGGEIIGKQKGIDIARAELNFEPELLVLAGDIVSLSGECDIPTVLIGTDPHVVDYSLMMEGVDHYVTMQKCYGGELWMPYAYDPNIHQKLDEDYEFDVVFCGLQYEQRKNTLEAMRQAGLKVWEGLGLIYSDYVKKYNEGLIAFNWSSQNDLPARFWEGLAMGRLVLTNHVPDLEQIDAKDTKHYVAFLDLEDAVEKAKWYSAHPDVAQKIAQKGYEWVQPHTYKNRVIQLLKDINV